jgi:hypothetical protein
LGLSTGCQFIGLAHLLRLEPLKLGGQDPQLQAERRGTGALGVLELLPQLVAEPPELVGPVH